MIVENPGGSDAGRPGTGGGRPSGRPAQNVLLRFRLGTDPSGNMCWYTEVVVYDGPVPPEDRANAIPGDLPGGLGGGGGPARCPDDTGPGLTLPTPGEVAEPFVRTIPMPVPQPEIDPGYNITGILAYLETKGTTTHHVEGTTILGRIDVAARGAYFVDWGDGSPEQGPYTFEGEPYPNGRITHMYQYKGTYTVTVRETWTADWELGGDSGTVPGLQTQASIPLDVREIQAVRNR